MLSLSKKLAVAAITIALTSAPAVALAQSHGAARAGVSTWSTTANRVYVKKTESNNKGAFAHYVVGGVDRVTGVNSSYNATLSTPSGGSVTAVNACISNGIFPATCSPFNNQY